MSLLAAAALVAALAASDPPDSSQRGSAPTPAQSNRAADDAHRGSRGSTAGEERTGPPSAGIENGEANGLAGGRTDEGPRGGTGVRGDDEAVTPDRARHPAHPHGPPPDKKGPLHPPRG